MKLTIKRFVACVLASCLVVCCFIFVGCGANTAQQSNDSQTDPVESVLTLGEPSDTALNIVFTNETGQELIDIAVIPAGSADSVDSADGSVFLMADEETLGAGEQVSVYVEPTEGQSLYDVVILIGEQRFALHNVDFANWDEAIIRIDGDVAYLEILLNGEPVSTLREEYDIVHPPVAEVQGGAGGSTGYYSGYDAGAVATVDQGEDSCVSDVVLR